jgi:hypothetical protein
MTVKANRNGAESVLSPRVLESLYFSLVKLFYDKHDREQTGKIAARLERALATSPEFSSSIRKILELHALTANTPKWKYVSRQYDFSDVSDRLDLLATLYDAQGELDRAISILLESQDYCASHKILFDAEDLLDELTQARIGATERAKIRPRPRRPDRV